MTVITKSTSSNYERNNLAGLQDCQWYRISRDVIRSPPPRSTAYRIHTSFWRMVSLLDNAGHLDGCEGENKMSPHGGNFKRSPVRAKFSNPPAALKNESYVRRCKEFLHQNADGDTQLHIAIVQELPIMVDTMVKSVPHPGLLDVKNDDSQTPMHVAVLTRQAEIVGCLLEGLADATKRDRLGNTALHLACQLGDLNCVKELTKRRHVKALVKPRKTKTLTSPCDVSCTKELTQLRLDTQVPKYYQSTDISCLKCENNSFKEMQNQLFETNEDSFLTYRRQTYKMEESESMKTSSYGCPTALHKNGAESLVEESFLPQELDVRNFEGESCAHVAAIHGHVDVLRWLFLSGADLNAKDGKSGNTVLHTAIERNIDSVCRFLLGECVEHLKLDTKNYAGLTAFHLAVGINPFLAGVIASLRDARGENSS